MPDTPSSQRAPGRPAGDDPALGLVDLLLDALLAATGAPHAEVIVDDPQGWHRERGTARPVDRPGIELSAEAGGRPVRLRVDADEDARRPAERFLAPLAATLALRGRLRDRLAEAETAVESVEATALVDLATGIVMARTGRDAAGARASLTAWADRHGTEVAALSPDVVLQLLTAGDL